MSNFTFLQSEWASIYSAALQELDSLFASLQQRAFAGRL